MGRDFDKEISTEPREEAVWFKLFGTKWNCADDVNGKRLLDNAALLDSDSVGEQRDGVLAIFEDTIVEDEAEDFFDRLNDPKTKIPLTTLVEIVGWLVDQYTDRPTVPPANSTTGRSNRGRTSGAKPSGRASRSVRSVPATT
jgi:hypothetical protein